MSANSMQGECVLVTGGAGFIGSHLVELLARRGAQVRVLDNFTTGKRQNLSDWADSVEWVSADVRDPIACREAVAGVTSIAHLAAIASVESSVQDPCATIATNVLGTTNIFQAARDVGIARIVYASSASVYGCASTCSNREGSEGAPQSPYALSKLMGEDLATTFNRLFDMDIVSLRYFNVYGPRQDPQSTYSAVVPAFFAASKSGRALQIHGSGAQVRDFVYVADVAEAHLVALCARKTVGGVYNVGTGRSTSIRQLAETIRAIAGGSVELEYQSSRPNDLEESCADPAKLLNAFGYVPQTSLQDGLSLAARYYLGL